MRQFLLTLVLFTFGCATQTAVTDRLETSPRHSEWAQITRDGRTIQTWVAYPEVSTKAPVVILIHENRGLTDWERGVADRLAENGYIALAPNMLSGIEVATADAAREAIGKLPAAQVMADLHAVADYAEKIPAADGTLQVAGFCWGGARTWLFANDRRDLAASYVFYGTGPQEASGVANINAPVYGFYGGNDARVNATIPKTEELMRAAGKRFEPVTYEGAGHAFMRAGMAADASPANKRAHDEAWARWLGLLKAAKK
ncbi:MAG TPA: dienelactone hydrolase family protein [Thermoanaerobaculia bacterium]|nr:dienelactone hydrolase family protein [Thermoanaerobaculia bacterium]